MTAAEVRGLSEFRKELKGLEGGLDKELTKAHKKIASEEAGRIQTKARSEGRAYAKAAKAVKGTGRAESASIAINPGKTSAHANPMFWGAKKRTGWYAQQKYAESSGRQFPEWVGNNWDAGSKTEGPYVINKTIAEDLDLIVDNYSEMLDDLFGRAFPD